MYYVVNNVDPDTFNDRLLITKKNVVNRTSQNH